MLRVWKESSVLGREHVDPTSVFSVMMLTNVEVIIGNFNIIFIDLQGMLSIFWAFRRIPMYYLVKAEGVNSSFCLVLLS